MSVDLDKPIEGHEYDGITELDNPLPKWWLFLFYATIVFGVGYYAYYELLGGPSHQQQLESQLAKWENNRKQEAPTAASAAAVDVDALLKDKAAMQAGATVFTQMCASCHGQKGEGVIGPNLTDNYWISSKGDFEGVMEAIKKGFPTKGMPPWEAVIPPDKHAPLAAYVLSLKGTNPPNGKAPQGELVE